LCTDGTNIIYKDKLLETQIFSWKYFTRIYRKAVCC